MPMDLPPAINAVASARLRMPGSASHHFSKSTFAACDAFPTFRRHRVEVAIGEAGEMLSCLQHAEPLSTELRRIRRSRDGCGDAPGERERLRMCEHFRLGSSNGTSGRHRSGRGIDAQSPIAKIEESFVARVRGSADAQPASLFTPAARMISGGVCAEWR